VGSAPPSDAAGREDREDSDGRETPDRAHDLGAELALALELADRADAITLPHFRAADLLVEHKADRSEVTEADRGSEAAIRARLTETRPDHAVLGEEEGLIGPVGARARWIVDPIDGTSNYVKGIPIWATLIALEREGEIVVGVASAPALGHRWWAERREGAFLDGAPIHVSNVSRLEDAYVSTTSLRAFPEFAALASRVAVARTYTDFWQYVLVAEGRIEAGCDTAQNEWDMAAPRLIVEEAGGRYTIDERLFLASNGVLHDQLRKSLLPA
jgi:histidinol-phosphatase